MWLSQQVGASPDEEAPGSSLGSWPGPEEGAPFS